jgi:hypothetical protein
MFHLTAAVSENSYSSSAGSLTLIDRRKCNIHRALIAGLARLASLQTKKVKRLQESYDVTSIICVTDANTDDVQIIFHGNSLNRE